MSRPQVTVRLTAAEQADDPSGTRSSPLIGYLYSLSPLYYVTAHHSQSGLDNSV